MIECGIFDNEQQYSKNDVDFCLFRNIIFWNDIEYGHVLGVFLFNIHVVTTMTDSMATISGMRGPC